MGIVHLSNIWCASCLVVEIKIACLYCRGAGYGNLAAAAVTVKTIAGHWC